VEFLRLGSCRRCGLCGAGGIIALNLLGYYIFRSANSQKNLFRSDPTNPAVVSLPQQESVNLEVGGWTGEHSNSSRDPTADFRLVGYGASYQLSGRPVDGSGLVSALRLRPRSSILLLHLLYHFAVPSRPTRQRKGLFAWDVRVSFRFAVSPEVRCRLGEVLPFGQVAHYPLHLLERHPSLGVLGC